jgi:hypothetical protein
MHPLALHNVEPARFDILIASLVGYCGNKGRLVEEEKKGQAIIAWF